MIQRLLGDQERRGGECYRRRFSDKDLLNSRCGHRKGAIRIPFMSKQTTNG